MVLMLKRYRRDIYSLDMVGGVESKKGNILIHKEAIEITSFFMYLSMFPFLLSLCPPYLSEYISRRYLFNIKTILPNIFNIFRYHSLCHWPVPGDKDLIQLQA